MNSTPIINSFVSGELSPKLAGRTDINQYYQSGAELTNMIVECYGGARKAPGTYFVKEVKTSANETRVIPFVFSDEQAYIIELGDKYMRFYMDNGQIESGGSAYEITTSYPSSVIKELQFASTGDILYITHPDYKQAKLTRSAHDSWTLTPIDYSTDPARPALMDENITATTITASGSTGTVVLTATTAIFDEYHVGSIWCIGPITGSYGYAQIVTVSAGGLQTVCTATVLYGGALPTDATTQWSEGAWSEYRGYPRSVTISEQRLIYGYTRSQPQTSWASVTGAYETFEIGSDDADAMMFKPDTNQVETINWLFPAQEILIGTAGGISVFGTGSDTTAMTPTTVRVKKKVNYGTSSIPPVMIGSSIFYWQQYNRILRQYVYSLSEDNYQAQNATVLSEHITESGIVDMAYQQSPDNILWCVRDDGKLAAYTFQAEQKVEAWTPHDTDGLYESVAVIPKDSYDEVWFVVKRYINGSWKRYIEYMTAPSFDDIEDCFFVHSGLTLNDHKDISNITVSSPTGLITIISTSHGYSNNDIVRIKEVEGMTELNLKKFIVANATSSTFTLQDLDGEDIDGTDYEDYTSGGEIRKCVDTVTGLDHLEGKTVQVLADGAPHPDCIVVSGGINLIKEYGQITVGLGYTGRIKSNDLEGNPGGVTSQGKIKRVSEAIANLYETVGGKIGTDAQMDKIPLRTSAMTTGQRLTPFTGKKRVAFPSGWAREKQVIIEQDQCLPLHVLSLVVDIEVN